MGLFINQLEHKEVFKNQGEIQTPNQNNSKIDPLVEFMLQQERAYATLRDYNQELEKLVFQQNKVQEKAFENFDNKVNNLKQRNIEHQEFEDQVLENIALVDDKFDNVNESNRVLAKQLKKIELSNGELVQKTTEQLSEQAKLSERLTKQKEIQKVHTTRLENQEVSLEKVIRQLEYLRSMINERTHFIIDKIGKSYDSTSAYIVRTIKNSKQPSSLISEEQKVEEESKGN